MRWKAELPLGCDELVDMAEVLTQYITTSTPHHLLLARARFIFQLAQRRDGKFLWMPLCPKADGMENFICRRRTSLFTLNTPVLDVHSYPLLSVQAWVDSPSFVAGSLAAQSKGQFYWTDDRLSALSCRNGSRAAESKADQWHNWDHLPHLLISYCLLEEGARRTC